MAQVEGFPKMYRTILSTLGLIEKREVARRDSVLMLTCSHSPMISCSYAPMFPFFPTLMLPIHQPCPPITLPLLVPLLLQ